jgi:hypothetical protein
VSASKMHCVPLLKVRNIERRHLNDSCPELRERSSSPVQVFSVRQNGEIRVPPEFCRSVKYASLTAHQLATDLVRRHRRKDFEYRVRDQGSLLG